LRILTPLHNPLFNLKANKHEMPAARIERKTTTLRGIQASVVMAIAQGQATGTRDSALSGFSDSGVVHGRLITSDPTEL
jgi:hypothetical protein